MRTKQTPEEFKQARREASRRWKENHSDYDAAYYQKNKEKLIAQQAEYRDKNRKNVRVKLMQHYHKRRARLLEGHTTCDICKCVLTKPNLDHNHDIAKNICGHLSNSSRCARCRRGVLCNNCNSAIGKFHEDLKVLDNAKRYLRYWTRKLGGSLEPL